MELELVEPNFYLSTIPASAERLADAILAELLIPVVKPDALKDHATVAVAANPEPIPDVQPGLDHGLLRKRHLALLVDRRLARSARACVRTLSD